VTLDCTDQQGLGDRCSASVTVTDQTPPALTCPAPRTVECTGSQHASASYAASASDNCTTAPTRGCVPASGASFALGSNGVHCTASDTCWGPLTPACTPPSGTSFGLGANSVACSVSDGSSNASSCSSGVTVVDTRRPVVTCAVTAPVIADPFSPNHNLIAIGYRATATDVCDGTLPVATAVFASEDDETPTATGEIFSPAAANVAVGTLRLRAERVETGRGRVYLVVASARDSSGNAGATCCTVAVPHDAKSASVRAVQSQADAARAACIAGNGNVPAGWFGWAMDGRSVRSSRASLH